MESEKELLDYVLLNTPTTRFRSMLADHNPQALYEAVAKALTIKFFGGDSRRMHLRLAQVFAPYTAGDYVLHCRDKQLRLNELRRLITTRRRMQLPDNALWVAEANQLITEINAASAPIRTLTKRYNQLHRHARNTNQVE